MRGTSDWEQQSNHIVGLLCDAFQWTFLSLIIALPSPAWHIQCLVLQKRNSIQRQDGEWILWSEDTSSCSHLSPLQVLIFNSAPLFIAFQSSFLFFSLLQYLANKMKSISYELAFLIFSTFILISFWPPEEITSALLP